MIKICNNKHKPIKLGNITIPAYGSVLLATLPSISDVNKLMNKGIISVFYVNSENSNVVTKNSKTNINTSVKNNTTENIENVAETNSTTNRKKRTHKETVSLIDNTTNETVELNTTKGDMKNASD